MEWVCKNIKFIALHKGDNGMISDDVFCNNSICDKFEKCEHSTYAIPIDGKKVLLVNLEDTEFCKKNEIS